MPPMVGMGLEWIFFVFGLSIQPATVATFRQTNVSKKLSTIAAKNMMINRVKNSSRIPPLVVD